MCYEVPEMARGCRFPFLRTATIVYLRDSFSVSKIDFDSVRRLFISHAGCLSSQPSLISFLSDDTLTRESIFFVIN